MTLSGLIGHMTLQWPQSLLSVRLNLNIPDNDLLNERDISGDHSLCTETQTSSWMP